MSELIAHGGTVATKTLFGESIRKRPTYSDPAVRQTAVALMANRLQDEFPDIDLSDGGLDELADAIQR